MSRRKTITTNTGETVVLTRRRWRKNREQLSVGQTGVKGTVVSFYQARNFGYIAPENGAAQIHFHMDNVPYQRMKCVGVGRTVFFEVGATQKGRLTAVVI